MLNPLPSLLRESTLEVSIALYTSTQLLINTLSNTLKGDIVDNPIAYVRTEDSFDLYARANSDINPYLNVKCDIIEAKEPRFIPLNGTDFVDISSLNPVYYQPKLLYIDGIYKNYQFCGTSSSSPNNVISIPNYANNKKYVIKVTNFNASEIKSLLITVYNGTMSSQHIGTDSTLTPSFNNGEITLSSFIWYSNLTYIIETY